MKEIVVPNDWPREAYEYHGVFGLVSTDDIERTVEGKVMQITSFVGVQKHEGQCKLGFGIADLSGNFALFKRTDGFPDNPLEAVLGMTLTGLLEEIDGEKMSEINAGINYHLTSRLNRTSMTPLMQAACRMTGVLLKGRDFSPAVEAVTASGVQLGMEFDWVRLGKHMSDLTRETPVLYSRVSAISDMCLS